MNIQMGAKVPYESGREKETQTHTHTHKHTLTHTHLCTRTSLVIYWFPLNKSTRNWQTSQNGHYWPLFYFHVFTCTSSRRMPKAMTSHTHTHTRFKWPKLKHEIYVVCVASSEGGQRSSPDREGTEDRS